MSLRRICLFGFIALVALNVAVNMAFGQGVGATGTILGTITDSTGAVLPNVKITVINTGTNATFATESNSAGDFNAPSLNPEAIVFPPRLPALKNLRPTRSRWRLTKKSASICL